MQHMQHSLHRLCLRVVGVQRAPAPLKPLCRLGGRVCSRVARIATAECWLGGLLGRVPRFALACPWGCWSSCWRVSDGASNHKIWISICWHALIFSGIILNGEKIVATKNLLLSSSCTLSLYHLHLIFIGILLTFSPMHFLGFNVHPFQILFIPGIPCHLLDQE